MKPTKPATAYTNEERRALLAQHEASGMTLQAFAQSVGLPTGTLSHWRWRLRERDQRIAPAVAPSPAFVQLAIDPPRTETSSQVASPRPVQPFEILFLKGVVVRARHLRPSRAATAASGSGGLVVLTLSPAVPIYVAVEPVDLPARSTAWCTQRALCSGTARNAAACSPFSSEPAPAANSCSEIATAFGDLRGAKAVWEVAPNVARDHAEGEYALGRIDPWITGMPEGRLGELVTMVQQYPAHPVPDPLRF